MNIEFKEGAVCYAGGTQRALVAGGVNWLRSDGKWIAGSHINNIDMMIDCNDFQLNEPLEGWYISKSELDTEEKYNKAVEVFGLFGYKRKTTFDETKMREGRRLRFLSLSDDVLFDAYVQGSTKFTFDQLMAIGELKRKMLNKVESELIAESNLPEFADSSNQVKNPRHYQLMDGVESIEIIARSMTQEQWKGFCLGNMLKYRIRAGKKDSLQQEIDKANFYGELYEMHKSKCYK